MLDDAASSTLLSASFDDIRSRVMRSGQGFQNQEKRVPTTFVFHHTFTSFCALCDDMRHGDTHTQHTWRWIQRQTNAQRRG